MDLKDAVERLETLTKEYNELKIEIKQKSMMLEEKNFVIKGYEDSINEHRKKQEDTKE
tara:strand:- start:11316 stop:11489 length:174 start_codon:yes stop_codon:yes gene_type:complete